MSDITIDQLSYNRLNVQQAAFISIFASQNLQLLTEEAQGKKLKKHTHYCLCQVSTTMSEPKALLSIQSLQYPVYTSKRM